MVLSPIPLSIAQGVYFLVTGIWPILHMRSFEAVTGPKSDRWLVKTVGVLVAVIGLVLIVAGTRAAISLEVMTVAVGSALGLTAIDVWYVARKIIRPIYLLDATVEIALVTLWVLSSGAPPWA